MLYVLTAADLGAVGPGRVGRLEDRKSSPISTIAPCSTLPATARTTVDDLLGQRREAVRDVPGRRTATQPWFAEHLDALPAGYLNATSPAAGGRRPASAAAACGPREAYRPPASISPRPHTVQFTVATSEADHAGHLPQAHRRAEQPRAGNPLGADSHPGRRPGAGPLLGSRSRLCRRAAAATGWRRSTRSLVAVAARPDGAAAVVPPHAGRSAAQRPAARRRRADPREHRQQHLRPLHDHRHLHPRPHRAALRHHPDAVRVGPLGLAGRRSARFSTRWSTSSTSPTSRTARSRTSSGSRRSAGGCWR